MTSGLGTTKPIEPADVLAFWRTAGPDKWFEKDALFDAEIAERFSSLWHAASEDKLRYWEETAEGALALVVVLDQFPRNMFRGDRRCYATDELARSAADRALRRGFDRQLPHAERQFFYLTLSGRSIEANSWKRRAYPAPSLAPFMSHGLAKETRVFPRFPKLSRLVGATWARP